MLAGDVMASIGSIIGLLLLLISVGILARKGVWVKIDESGVSYVNLWGKKSFKWEEISFAYYRSFYFQKNAYIKTVDGKSRTIPIDSRRAKEISDVINNRLDLLRAEN